MRRKLMALDKFRLKTLNANGGRFVSKSTWATARDRLGGLAHIYGTPNTKLKDLEKI